nr:squalene/phytoene synthase family protein [Microbacterium sp. ZXX196]
MYTATARAASARVIGAYSTSFGLASRLLPRRVRGHIADIYALVRVADEVVDGPAGEAGATAGETLELVDALERDTLRALRTGFSANLVVHAFAVTARRTGIDEALVRPFFASMRVDARGVRAFDDAAYRAYIHGSAEVVGSMCLRAFAQEGRGIAIDAQLDEGARRLGAAFQKVNFLRDLADDCDRLGRTYLPGIDPARFTEADKDAIVDDIDADLAVARRAIDRLPPASRRATAAAWGLFSRLNRILAETPAAEVRRARASVPAAEKARILALAAAGRVSA